MPVTRNRFPSSGPFVPSSGQSVQVANLAALAQVTDGDLAWVESLRCYWHRDSQSTLAPDGITIVSAASGGRWERLETTSSVDWGAQAAWVVDSATGSDEASGADAANALATVEEFTRRMTVAKLIQDTTITVAAGTSAEESDLVVDVGAYHLTVIGTPAVVTSGTLSAYTEHDHTVPEGTLIESGTIADWTPYVGQRIRITSGTATGAVAWIESADPHSAGLGVARCSIFTEANGLLSAPSALDDFVIETLPRIGSVNVSAQGDSATVPADRLVFESLNIGPIFDLDYSFLDEFPSVRIFACDISPSDPADGCYVRGPHYRRPMFNGCAFQNANRQYMRDVDHKGGTVRGNAGTTVFAAAGNGSAQRLLFADGNVIVDAQYLFVDTQAFGPRLTIAETGVAIGFNDGLSGDGNAIGLVVGTGGENADLTIYSNDLTLLNLIGSTTDIRLAAASNINLSWSDLPYDGSQRGTATLVAGTATIPASDADTLGVLVSRNTAGGTALGILEAPAASRTDAQFVVNSLDPASVTVETNDLSSVDWYIPPPARQIRFLDSTSIAPATP